MHTELNISVGDDTTLRIMESTKQRDAIAGAEFMREPHDDAAGDLTVLAALLPFNRVPQNARRAKPCRRTGRHQNSFIDNLAR